MSVRPPSIFRKALDNTLQSALEQDVLIEKADALTRQTKKLELALVRLTQTDPQDCTALAHRREEAGEALWMLTVQRELCGLYDHRSFLRHMGVPSDLYLQAGPIRPGRMMQDPS